MIAAAAVLLLAALYAAGVRRVRRWPARRSLAFAAGLLALAAIALPPVDAACDRALAAHMAEHLAIVLVAAPLLVLGAPLTLALRATGRALPALRRLGHPLVAWSAFVAAMTLTHLPGFYELAVDHGAVHAAEHAIYLWTAFGFWWALLDPLAPRPLGGLGRMAFVLTAMLPMTLVGVVLARAGRPLYPHYTHLADQQLAGNEMWVVGSVAMGVLAVAAAWAAFEREERRAVAREAYELRTGR